MLGQKIIKACEALKNHISAPYALKEDNQNVKKIIQYARFKSLMQKANKNDTFSSHRNVVMKLNTIKSLLVK